jgi:hypothetical protein
LYVQSGVCLERHRGRDMRPPGLGKAGRFRGALTLRPAYFPFHYPYAAFPCRAGKQVGAALGNYSPGPYQVRGA